MTYEFLPREEPGKPLKRVPPGFADSVMQRIEDYERQQKRRWAIAVALTAACLFGGGLFLSTRLLDDGGKAGVPQVQAGPVTPPVKAAPAPHLAASQNAVKAAPAPYLAASQNAVKAAPAPYLTASQKAAKKDTPGAAPAGHDPAVDGVSEEFPSGYIVISLDGREYHCPPEVLQRMGHGDDQIQEVRDDGKGVKPAAPVQPFSGGRCHAVPPTKQ